MRDLETIMSHEVLKAITGKSLVKLLGKMNDIMVKCQL